MKIYCIIWFDTHSGTNIYHFANLDDAVKYAMNGIKEVYIDHGNTDFELQDMTNFHDPNLCMIVEAESWYLTIGEYGVN